MILSALSVLVVFIAVAHLSIYNQRILIVLLSHTSKQELAFYTN